MEILTQLKSAMTEVSLDRSDLQRNIEKTFGALAMIFFGASIALAAYYGSKNRSDTAFEAGLPCLGMSLACLGVVYRVLNLQARALELSERPLPINMQRPPSNPLALPQEHPPAIEFPEPPRVAVHSEWYPPPPPPLFKTIEYAPNLREYNPPSK